jgi:metal-sulfur cluster biosynthetic enzyme
MSPEEKIIESLKTVKDPELGLDIISLGLIYKVTVREGKATILMTLTFPGCPYGPQIVEQTKKKALKFAKEVVVEVTFNPPWDLNKISPEAKMYLGIPEK